MSAIRHVTIDGRAVRVRTHPADTAAPHAWDAIDDDRYDGAPDAGFQPIGRGATEHAAIVDLVAQIEERNV